MKKSLHFIILCLTVFNFNNCYTQNSDEAALEIDKESIVEEYHDYKDYDDGVDYILENYKDFENNYRVNYLLGEMGLEGERWEASKKGYERTLELVNPKKNRGFHESIYYNDEIYYWNSLDGLGVVYYKLKDYSRSLEYLKQANDWLAYVDVPSKDKGKHYYNLACAYGLNDQCAGAVAALENAVLYNTKYWSYAKTDSDFDAVRTEAAFQMFLYGK